MFLRENTLFRTVNGGEVSQSELLTHTLQTSRLTAAGTRSKGNDTLLVRYGDVGRVSALWFLEHHVIFNNHVNSETY